MNRWSKGLILGVALCAAAVLGFIATYAVLAAARPHESCSGGIESMGCHWPRGWAMLAGAFGTLGSFALVVTGVLALVIGAADARKRRERAYLARLSLRAAREPR